MPLETPTMKTNEFCIFKWSRPFALSNTITGLSFFRSSTANWKKIHKWTFFFLARSNSKRAHSKPGEWLSVFCTVSWSECSFSVCCKAGGWLCRWQKWKGPGTEVQLWPKSTDSPAVICHPKTKRNRCYRKHLCNVLMLKRLKIHKGGLSTFLFWPVLNGGCG